MRILVAALAAFFFCVPAFAHSVDHAVQHEFGVSAPTLGGSFSLTDQNGQPFTDANLKGQPTAIFFGFTSCPDICPTTLFQLTELRKKLGPNGEKLRVVMVTVDPATDTPERLKTYLGYFDPGVVGLTGTQAQVDAMAGLFFVTHWREAGVITHSASVYPMNGAGRFSSAISYQEDPVSALRKLNLLFQQCTT